jgi:hypothetical protein
MSSTRHAPPGSDPDAHPERFLSSTKIAGINIPMSHVVRVARDRTDKERKAMIWLTNYARLRNLTADALSDEIDLSKADIRTALTDPYAELARFVRQVRILRDRFETTIPVMYKSEVFTTVTDGIRFAAQEIAPVEIIGKTRLGKTDCARPEFLRMMDRALWVDCPEDESDRTLLFDFARALGISTGGGKKACQLRPQIKACFGPGRIEVVFIDEAHRLWPADIRTKPKRVEFIRSLYDGEHASVIVLATPQYCESMNQCIEKSERWSPGQWDGRVIRFHLDDTMPDHDLRGIALHHEPRLTEDSLSLLITTAKARDGYAGAMVNVIRIARFRANGAPITAEIIRGAIKQQAKGSRIEALAKAHAAIAGKGKTLHLKAA